MKMTGNGYLLSKATENIKVLSLFLKIGSEGADLMSAGSLFHLVDAECTNAALPWFEVTLGTTSRPDPADLSGRDGS